MKISEFNATLEVMKTVYDFKDDETELLSIHDMKSCAPRIVEIYTVDRNTGTEITMKRNVETKAVSYYGPQGPVEE